MENPETWTSSTQNKQIERSTVEQVTDYHDLMVNIVRRVGKNIRCGRLDETASTRPGTEYLLPGSHEVWSEPSASGEVHICRDRTYSASFRSLGRQAGRLIVLETRSERSDTMISTN